MSLFARSAARAVPRTASKGIRNLATDSAVISDYHAKAEAVKHHAAQTTDLWRKISFYVAFPATFVTCAWVYNVEAEHAAHEEHLKAENDGKLPQPPEYEYLNRRVKPFPWGMNSLFFHPEFNKDMEQHDE
ncbi:hypothetical protein HYDPIDRAFT_37008 [Hydnomerulius pinastri MD-312]|nr:hypothetical protein HYDPIDRAFT_37008 [Hydnomerulius pinastri MD-312]